MVTIKGASYVCYDETSEPYGGPCSKTTEANFYTFDGKLIGVVSGNTDMHGMTRRLDPKAPKPKVCEIRLQKFFVGKNIDKTVETDFIMFYDINGYLIGGDVYYGCNQPPSTEATEATTTNPSLDDLADYTNKYDLSNVPYYTWVNNVGSMTIKSASYYCHEKPGSRLVGYKLGSKTVTFYTFDGQQLITVQNNGDMSRRLDPDTPKPQISKYKIYYWAGIPLGGGLTYAPKGDYILFYDNNGNGINGTRYQGVVPPTAESLEVYNKDYNLQFATYDGYDDSERVNEEIMMSKRIGLCSIL